MKKLFLIIFALFLLGNSTIKNKSDYNIPSKARSIFTDDIDLDNDKDIIIGHLTGVGYTNPSITILKNDGYGYFDIFDTSITHFGYQYDIFSSDFDGDFYPEIVSFLTDENNSEVGRYLRIFFNDVGTFNEYQDISLDQSESFDYKTFGDANGDGLTDIIVSSYGCQCWGILYNQGQGNFAEPEYYNTDFSPTSITCGNLNDDSYDDIVVGGADVNIYLPNESGFNEIVFTNGSWDVFIDDFDNDGDNDIVGIDGMYTWNYFSYMENTGNNNFVQHTDTTTHPGCLDFFLSDLDCDGLAEILGLSNSLSGIYIFYNKGNFHIYDPVFIPIDYYGESTRGIHCDDLDGNGYSDIIVTRGYGGPLPANLTILFNDGNGNFVENPITRTQPSNLELQTSNLNCYPNPFKDNITIQYNLHEDSFAELTIYDLSGKMVNKLCSKNLYTGNQLLTWNGRDFNGREVQAGTYLICLNTGRQTITQQIVKLAD